MKRCRSVVEIGSSQGTITEATTKATPTTPKTTRIANYREEDLFHRPNSRSSSIGSSPYKDSQLSLYTDGVFQQHYNSIMFSTKLVDSCVEALKDITTDDDNSSYLLQSNENIFLSNRLASVAEKNAAQDGHTISDDQVIFFENWLIEMEKRVADYPTLSQIYGMEAKEMRYQFGLHSKTFNDIVAQPCIVKNSKRDDHRDLEERYHLLYLRAYEVLLLLEGLPFSQTCNNNLTDYENVHNENDDDNYDDVDDELLADDDAFDANDDQVYNHDSKENGIELSLVQHGQTFEFDHFDDSSCNDKCVDRTEAPYDSDLVSLFDNMDEIYETIKHGEHEYGMQTSPDAVLKDRMECNIEQSHEYRYNRMDNTNNITANSYFGHAISMYEQQNTTTIHNTYNKVYNWLNTRTINENTYHSESCNNFVYIYKAKSESNLDAARHNRWGKYFSSSTSSTASFICPTTIGPITSMLHVENAAHMNDIVDESQMDWDYLELDLVATMSNVHSPEMDVWNEYSMYTLEWALCYFGEDYEHHIETASLSSNEPYQIIYSDEEIDNHNISQGSVYSLNTISDREATASTATLHTIDTATTDDKKVSKRRRRRINKRIKKIRNTQTSVPAISTKTSIVINNSSDSEPSAPNSRPSSPSSSTGSSSATDSSKNIRYNSDDQSFELFTDDADAPIKHKVNELKPEDFHEIIKMCRNNIDCVITVLGAEPNRVLTVNYCQKMKFKRQAVAAAAATASAKNNLATNTSSINIHNEMCCCYNQNNESMIQQSFKNCNCMRYTCLCKWITQTIAMIINFLLDCWNIFRNMRLYSYLGKVLQGFFASTKEVAKRIKSQRELTALTYTY